MFVILQGNACVATHTVTKVDTKAQPHAAGVAVGAMENWTRAIVIQVANSAKILGKWFSIGFAVGVDASIFRGLQSIAFHTHDL